MSSVRCPRCDTVVEDGLWFCPTCATQVAGPGAVPSPEHDPEYEPWGGEDGDASETEPVVAPPREAGAVPTIPPWMWAVIALAAFAVVGIVAGVLAAH